MARIRNKNTSPEMQLRKSLHQRGFRYRLHPRKFPGNPDLILPRYNAAVFIHGCFWHQHSGCRLAATVKDDPDGFWKTKLANNVERDKRSLELVQDAGWRTAVVWECALKRPTAEQSIAAVEAWLRSATGNLELPAGGHG